jgi:hypothetical protein
MELKKWGLKKEEKKKKSPSHRLPSLSAQFGKDTNSSVTWRVYTAACLPAFGRQSG